jgi:hypothetical protein
MLFIPKSYMHIPAYPEVSVSIFLNPLLMLVMIFTIVFDIRYANDNNKVFTANAWMVWSKYRHIMTGFIFCVLVLALVLIAYISTTDKKTSTNPDVIQKLESYAVHSENASDYRASVGYYLQWVLLEPVNPESHIRLARSFSKTERDWLSYQEYKRAFFLSSEDSAFRLESEDGIQTALSATVCDMTEKNEFKWSTLIQQEYNELFPHLPQISVSNCNGN